MPSLAKRESGCNQPRAGLLTKVEFLSVVPAFDDEAEAEAGKATLLLGVEVVAILCLRTLRLQCSGSGFD